ncbi:MAG: glycosyltransferase [Fusicatenibacter saccharivorans]
MLFSIVVPVYNVEKYLQECLDSIIKQILQMSEACEIMISR